MSISVIVIAIMLACSIAVSFLLWFAMRHRPPLAKPLPFIRPPHRKLSDSERIAAEHYIASLPRPTSVGSHAQRDLALTSQSNNVYPVTRAITRYGLSTDEPHKWRYFLDNVEVHLPPAWEQFIAEENVVELIKTQTLPLVISLNGHTLPQYHTEAAPVPAVLGATGQNASIRKEEGVSVELVSVRKESPEEHALSRPDGIREAIYVGFALLLFFFSLIGPLVVMPWLILAGLMVIAVSISSLYRRPQRSDLLEIHCLRGAPKRWGLFGESNQGQTNNISMGSIDLIYPSHWQNYPICDLGQITEVDIYLNRHVVRQGRFLSLQDEVRRFPLQHWRKNAVLAGAALMVLLMLITWMPPGMPVKLSLAWLKGTESLQVNSVAALEKVDLKVGDSLKVSGRGMCSLPGIWHGNHNMTYMPFDCSAIYWNSAPPHPLPQSDIIDKATALLDTTRQQLHPQGSEEAKLNPQLATAIEKSGMTLLDDFSDIVLKTEDLCRQEADCVRLKNALVNLSNVKDWETLVKHANSGALTGMNVLLRPVSAESLENLVNNATAAFFYRETRHAAESLNSPAPGGFLIVSDKGQQMVNLPAPVTSLFDYNAPDQWPELQRRAAQLLSAPFQASGLITSISVDANGTRHIVLHTESDAVALRCTLGSSLLLLLLLGILGCNTMLAVQRLRHNRLRQVEIQRYYEQCFSTLQRHSAPTPPAF